MPETFTPDELHSALFANLVTQQGNLALMFLGRVANPETGEKMKDLEGARMFIDQLEMLEKKTKGNLSREESALLQQTLFTVRMAFVEESRSAAAPSATPESAPPSEPAAASSAGAGESGEDSKKKFVKKYSSPG